MSEQQPLNQDNAVFQQSQIQTQPQASPPQEIGYQIPVESVTLPSKGKLYSQDHPLYNETSVDIKCMTAKEEDLLTSRALIKNGTVMSKLISSCLMNKTIDPDTLITGDRNAILIAIRVTGYGGDYKVKMTCPECDEDYESEFSLSGLKIKPLTDEPVQPNANLFSFTLPLSGLVIQYRLLTGADESEISKIQERQKKLGSQIEHSVTLRLFQAIESVNGEVDRQKIQQIVSQLRAGDSRALRKRILEIQPTVDMKQWSTCTYCSEQSEVSVPLGPTFFWPDYRE